ncbi:MAG: protein kinase [Deltaproteobacteria bacterium]|nr:protein kinase [Deltaproteobacteria bacterium]
MTPPVLGKYRLDAQVGQGGMGVVWRGYDPQMRRAVAVKVLHPHLQEREEIRRRFAREAHAAGRLQHPHILDVYDFSGPDAEPSYLVTEFIPGLSLRAFAEAHPFDPPELAAMALLPIAEALEHAHAKGVVHRDLKPENVMVRDDGVVKLTDFGLAALLEPNEKMTASGSILGSPGHLAPETIEGKKPDPLSDLFSFGTVLYWLATGAMPFRAETPAALLQTILECRPVDPRLVRRSVSDGLARVIQTCLARDPAKRYPNAGALRQELHTLLIESGVDDPVGELKAFVTGQPPEDVAKSLRARLVSRCMRRGEAALSAKKTTQALNEFARALSLDPTHALAKEQVARIRKREKTMKRVRRAVIIVLGTAAVVAAGVPLVRAVEERHERERQEQAAREAQVRQEQAVLAEQKRLADEAEQKRLAEERRLSDEQRRAELMRELKVPTADPTRRPPPRNPRVRDDTSATGHGLTAAGKVSVTLKPPLTWARLTLDGKDLGSDASFTRELSPGPHEVTVRHDCCADNTYTIDVRPGVDRIPLKFGAPKPARLDIRGAPADARVFVDEVFLGSVGDLASRPISTDDKQMREVLLAVGDRSKRITLKAGYVNHIDYLRDLDGPR